MHLSLSLHAAAAQPSPSDLPPRRARPVHRATPRSAVPSPTEPLTSGEGKWPCAAPLRPITPAPQGEGNGGLLGGVEAEEGRVSPGYAKVEAGVVAAAAAAVDTLRERNAALEVALSQAEGTVLGWAAPSEPAASVLVVAGAGKVPFSPPLHGLGSPFRTTETSPSRSDAVSPDAQALHERIVALQQRLNRSLVTHAISN